VSGCASPILHGLGRTVVIYHARGRDPPWCFTALQGAVAGRGRERKCHVRTVTLEWAEERKTTVARIEKDIEVAVPIRTAYNQWTQFEEFPNFMEGVHEVRQIDDRHLRWRAEVAGREHEWDAEIREQVPDQKVIWQSTSGPLNAGMVKFDPVDSQKTRVHLEMSYEPDGAVENVGDALGFMSRRVEGDLQRFKEFIEERGVETGAWRGEIENPDVPGGHTQGSLDA
jgi:uncharacterized membrane protein